MFGFVTKEKHNRELAALERLLAVAEKGREDARQDAVDAMRLHELERRRYDELLQTTLAMKAAGAQTIAVTGGAVPVPSVPFVQTDALKELIGARAGNNSALRGIMLKQLTLDRRNGISEEEIEARIMAGVSSDDHGIQV